MSSTGTKRKASEEAEEDHEVVEKKEEKTESEEAQTTSSAKKQKKTSSAAATAPQTEAVFELSNKRKITVGMFAKKVLVNIREYYEDRKTGEEKPGNKGIALNLEQWNQLKDQADEIDGAVRVASDKEQVFTLSDKRKVTVSLFKGNVLVNIREYYEDKKTGEEKPGSKGIALTMHQWEPLKAQLESIDAAVKERST